MLMGHSSGAHLAVMGCVELTLKRLLHNPQAIIRAEGGVTPPPVSLRESLAGSTLLSSSLFRSQPSSNVIESIKFEDRHFDGSSQSGSEGSDQNGVAVPKLQSLGPESGSTTGSFFIIAEGEKEPQLSATGGSESFFMVQKGKTDSEGSGNGSSNGKSVEILEPSEVDVEEQETYESKPDETERLEQEGKPTCDKIVVEEEKVAEVIVEGVETGVKVPSQTVMLEDTNTVPTSTVRHELVIEDDDTMTRSQRDVRDILSCIQCVIGESPFTNINISMHVCRQRGHWEYIQYKAFLSLIFIAVGENIFGMPI